jgi:hypothetical protein
MPVARITYDEQISSGNRKMTTVFQHIERLKAEYTDKYVVVDETRPELRRFAQMTGTVKTVNMSGRALVQFDAESFEGWIDIDVDYLKVVDAPPPKPEKSADKKTAKPTAAKPTAAKKPAAKAAAGSSVNDILAAARAGAAPKPKPAGDKPAKMSVQDMLAAARGKKPAEAKAETAKVDTAKPAKMSVAEMLAAARSPSSAAAEKTPAEPEPVAEPELVADEVAAPAEAPAATTSSRDLPTTTAEILEFCRQVDSPK